MRDTACARARVFTITILYASVCVCACVRACVRVCVRACVRACVCARARIVKNSVSMPCAETKKMSRVVYKRQQKRMTRKQADRLTYGKREKNIY